jgi:hypothetical protein
MNRIIEEVVIGQGQYNINMDINAKLRAAMDGVSSHSTVTQARRVVARPKTTA